MEEFKLKQEFLEGMITELEEKYRIELRKKALIKNQLDEAYHKGAAAIQNEAIKMSSANMN